MGSSLPAALTLIATSQRSPIRSSTALVARGIGGDRKQRHSPFSGGLTTARITTPMELFLPWRAIRQVASSR